MVNQEKMGLAHATGVHECNMMRTHKIRPLVECMILMRKHEKKYFCAQSRHTQGTVVARFLESLIRHSLGTVLAQFRHILCTKNRQPTLLPAKNLFVTVKREEKHGKEKNKQQSYFP